MPSPSLHDYFCQNCSKPMDTIEGKKHYDAGHIVTRLVKTEDYGDGYNGVKTCSECGNSETPTYPLHSCSFCQKPVCDNCEFGHVNNHAKALNYMEQDLAADETQDLATTMGLKCPFCGAEKVPGDHHRCAGMEEYAHKILNTPVDPNETDIFRNPNPPNRSRTTPCQNCGGTGTDPDTKETCSVCGGEGSITKSEELLSDASVKKPAMSQETLPPPSRPVDKEKGVIQRSASDDVLDLIDRVEMELEQLEVNLREGKSAKSGGKALANDLALLETMILELAGSSEKTIEKPKVPDEVPRSPTHGPPLPAPHSVLPPEKNEGGMAPGAIMMEASSKAPSQTGLQVTTFEKRHISPVMLEREDYEPVNVIVKNVDGFDGLEVGIDWFNNTMAKVLEIKAALEDYMHTYKYNDEQVTKQYYKEALGDTEKRKL